MGVHPDGNQVHAVGPEGTAAHQTARAQGQAAPETVDRERLHGVGRAARVEAAGGNPAGSRALVGGDQGHRVRVRAGCTWSRTCSRRHPLAAGLQECRGHVIPEHRGGLCGRTGLESHQIGAARQVCCGGMDHGAGPPSQRVPDDRAATIAAFAYATWGNTPGSPDGAGRNVTRTGPLAPRARERCSSAKATRRVMRPTVREGAEASDGETVAPLEPP